jgi:predicted nucleic acid-binding protein
MSPLLLDSGVWLAARDADDRHHRAAVELVTGERRVTALDLTFYEVANVAIRSWRSLERARIVSALVFEACADTIARVDDLAEETVELAELHGLTAYDAAYVAAAAQNGWTLVSTDMRDLVEPGFAVTPGEAAAN